MVTVTIDNRTVDVPEGTTILEAARKLNIDLPTLCYHPDQAVKANCRICVVEVVGQRVLQPACSYPVYDGMVVDTNSSVCREARRNILELILAHHAQDCLRCTRNGTCELQAMSHKMNVNSRVRYPIEIRSEGKDLSSPSIVRDPDKCINCGRCIHACSEVQTVHALTKENRGFDTIVKPAFGKKLAESPCINCGQCVQACPVGALVVHDDTAKVWAALSERNRWNQMLCTYDESFEMSGSFEKSDSVVVAQIAPAVRITIAEEFDLPPGAVSAGQIVAAMRILGFDAVFDTDFTADLTIMEEGHELLHRLQNGGTLPMITSCSPGWIKFCETFYPDLLDHLSSCKSPQQMFGALVKTYYAEKIDKDPKKIMSVSIMPCTAKKFECTRPEMGRDGYRDIDVVLTVRELASMIREAGINIEALPESEFDLPFGIGSGAGEIFGATGGVMEAALRTVYEVVTGKELEKLDFEAVRGFVGVKEATVDLNGTIVKVAVANGLGNARKVMDAIKAGTADYHFIEIMACPGGCIGGGGNPVTRHELIRKRIDAVYSLDKRLAVRQSHKNPVIDAIYKEYLGKPNGEKSHHLLHTHYTDRSNLS